MAIKFRHTRSGPGHFAWQTGADHQRSFSNEIRPIGTLCTTKNRTQATWRPALLQKFKGRKLPLLDRVEITIIEEEQPRWLSFLNKEQDLIYPLPYAYMDIAAPNGKLAPNLARQDIKMYRTLASDVGLLTYFNMEDPVVGGYSPEKIALRRDCLGDRHRSGDSTVLARAGCASSLHADAQHLWLRSKVSYYRERYNLPLARALLDMYGYVDRDGDGWREQPDGSPLVLQWATTPDQRARRRDDLRRKDMNALGIRVAFVPAKWPENLKNARAGKLMMWNLGRSAASPDGRPALDLGASVHFGGQNLARFKNEEFDRIYQRISVIPDGPERERLFLRRNG